MAKSPTLLFATLLKKSKLSNQVSQIALIDAYNLWIAYRDTQDDLRDYDTLTDILARLDIILSQVANKNTRIEPTQWHNFCQLHTLIATALRTGKPLEPNDGQMAVALQKATNKSSIKAVA